MPLLSGWFILEEVKDITRMTKRNMTLHRAGPMEMSIQQIRCPNRSRKPHPESIRNRQKHAFVIAVFLFLSKLFVSV